MIPTRLKIGGHIFKVVISEEVEDCGYLDRDKNEIKIREGLSESQQESTLLHEIIHACNNELEHSEVDALAEQLYQVLKDNSLWNI